MSASIWLDGVDCGFGASSLLSCQRNGVGSTILGCDDMHEVTLVCNPQTFSKLYLVPPPPPLLLPLLSPPPSFTYLQRHKICECLVS